MLCEESRRPLGAVPFRLLALLVLTLMVGCGGSEPPPTVLFVSLDTTRYDHLGIHGESPSPSPRIDEWAGEGVIFDNARASNPITLPSHTTMLTGVPPLQHGIRDNAVFRLKEEALTVTEVLREHGVRTAASVGSFVLGARYGLAQGFERYDCPNPEGANLVSIRPADQVVDRATEWLTGLQDDEPAFLWVHFYDPHAPRHPPQRFVDQWNGDSYRAAIAFCDEQIGRLRKELEKLGRSQNLLFVLTADHGESLGEHGEDTHGVFVYDAVMRVPLVIASDRWDSLEGQRSAAAVGIEDVAPTLLDFFGLDASALPACSVPSLRRSAETGGDASRPQYVESYLPFHSFRWHPYSGIVVDGWKLIDGKRDELYHCAQDSAELVDLVDEEPDRRAALDRALERFREAHPELGWHREVRVSGELAAQLRRLGYVVSQGGADDEAIEELPDPHERIGDIALIDRARAKIREGGVFLGKGPPELMGDARYTMTPAQMREHALKCYAEARGALTELHQRNPSDPYYHEGMGQISLALERFEQGREHCEQAVVAEPGRPSTRFDLALCYQALGREDWAVTEVHKLLSLEPSYALGYQWLASFHSEQGHFGEAAWWLRQLGEFMSAEAFAPYAPQLQQWERRAAAGGQAIEGPLDFPFPEGFDLRPERLREE